MTLTLSSSEQGRMAEAIEALASPFEHGSVHTWGEAVIATVETALEHEGCMFQLPVEGKPLGIGFERLYQTAHIEAYRGFEPYLASTGAYARAARLGVVTHETAYGPHYEEVMASPYIQELFPAAGIHDMMTITVPASNRARDHQGVGQIYLNMLEKRRFSDRQVQVARLLHPALKAGVASFRMLEAVRHRMGTLLDAGGAACAVFSLAGRLLHRTPALETVLAREPRRDRLAESSRRLVRSLASDRRAPLASVPTPTAFVGARGRYTLVPTRVRDLCAEPVVLVSVTPPPASPGLPAEGEVRERFGLTRRQAEVALLLADRHSNKEIAAALGLSVHTARHHVEHVLSALGVGRRGVRDLLLGSDSAA